MNNMTRRWTRITPDNVDYVYELDENGPLAIAWVDSDGVTHYGNTKTFGLTLNTMAKSGDRYYYYEIPKLHKIAQY